MNETEKIEPNLKVGHTLELRVGRSIEILLCHHNSFLEQMFIDSLSVLLGHQHLKGLTFYL